MKYLALLTKVRLLLLIVACMAAGDLQAQNLENIGETEFLKTSGGLSLRSVAYGVSGLDNRREPYSYVLSGNVTFDIYELSLPFSFTYSEQERGISQPFNQFGVSPRYKWITAHLGYRNMDFSPFTLAGHQFLGAGLELNPGNLRLGFMYGRLQRAIAADTSRDNIEQPAYERTGLAAKIGFGTESNHIDISFLKAQDDENSLDQKPLDPELSPAENLVIGISGRFRVIDNLSLHFDIAASDYTRDITADPLETDDNELMNLLSGIIEPRVSTQVYTALKTGFSLNIDNFSLNSSYSRIDPDYQSMGAYYMDGDLEQISLAPTLSLMNHKLNINSTLSWRHDNVNDTKEAETQWLSPTLYISYQPGATFGIDFQYSDNFTSQSAGSKPINDTSAMDQSMPLLSISPRYSINDSAHNHSILMTLMYQTLVDNNSFTAEFSEYNTINVNLAYSLSFVKDNLSLSAAVNTTRLENFGGEFYNSGVSLGANKTLWQGQLSLGATVSYSIQQGGNSINAGLNGNLRLGEQHNFDLGFTLLNSGATTGTDNDTFSEYTAIAGYAFSF